ncbi:MAG TPA: SMP-30/gluconolactonase/LRE family protein [Solirubrobacteraceae bacterium]|nr:SMP-30/gluconolactonase/LRE family protein [Solirubrobacteraceae bacterium]
MTVRPPSRLIRVVETDAHEGPVYAADEPALYFTSLPPGAAVKRLALDGGHLRRDASDVSVLRADANGANGMTLAPDGRLLVCEQGSLTDAARLTLVDRRTGAAEVVVDGVGGRPLNSPNDVVVKSDGTIWFTDPSYGFLQGFRPRPQLGDVVYRHDPATGGTTVVADGFDKPNGLAFSPDERVLYVGDSGAPQRLDAFDVAGDGRGLTGRRRLAPIAPGTPDGIEVDADGRVYACAAAGVQVLAPDGEPLGLLELPGAVNLTWGGAARDVLFITADSAIWAAVGDDTPEHEEA